MADQTAKLLQHLRVASVAVLGWSDGGILGLLLAVRHPSLVRRLAVTGASTRPVPDALTAEFIELLRNWDPRHDSAGQARYARRFADSASHYPVFIEKVKELWFSQPRPGELGAGNLKAIRAPTLVIAGDQDVVRLEHTVELYRAVPNARLLILPGTGHETLTDRPEWLNPILLAFFDESERRTASPP